MKISSNSAITIRSTLLALLLFGVSQSLYAAEKKTVICNNKFGPILQRLALPVADRAGHEIGTQTRQGASSSPDPDWDGSTVTGIGQFDMVNGSGQVWGYNVRTFKSGDKVFTKFKFSLKKNSEGDQTQGMAEGAAEILGGTGKFENIKGSVTFTGQLGPAGGSFTETLEVEY
jgi:hypothetical protein